LVGIHFGHHLLGGFHFCLVVVHFDQ
jgi:hypothetical protein